MSPEKIAELAEESTKMSVVDITETAGYDHRATKKLLRKLDWHIIPFMSLIYLLVLKLHLPKLMKFLNSIDISTDSASWIAPILEMPAWIIWRKI